jgi:VCBS repeat-containing protein
MSTELENYDFEGDLIIGTKQSDVLTGDDLSNIILGLSGNDVIDAGGGDDYVAGGLGDDYIAVGSGNDLVFGGLGWDTVAFDGDIRDYVSTQGLLATEVVHSESGDHNILFGVERLLFDNAEIFLDGRNNGPVADDVFVEAEEDAAPVSGNLLDASDAYDFDGDALSISSVNGSAANVGTTIVLASGALLTVNADGSYVYDQNGAFDWLNDGGQATDTVAFDIFDGTDTTTRELSFTIDGVTDGTAPVANDVTYVLGEDFSFETFQFDATDADDGDTEALVYLSSDMLAPGTIYGQGANTKVRNNGDGSFEATAGINLQKLAAGEVQELT